jgi:hypothetical protein
MTIEERRARIDLCHTLLQAITPPRSIPEQREREILGREIEDHIWAITRELRLGDLHADQEEGTTLCTHSMNTLHGTDA